MHWSLVPAFLALLAPCLAPAQDNYGLAPEVLLLARIRVHMNQTLARQPNYTCVERVERARRRAPRHKYELIDMLRLEVALVDGKELFAWPGSSKFEVQDLEKIVPRGGAIGNGNFALFARQVFLSNVPVFSHKGIVDLNGRRTVRYDYQVPQMLSGFNLKVNHASAVVGFHGSFWADPDTLDLIRLEIIADDIPSALQLSQATNSMDYARVRIGDGDFLLPAASELIMTQINGDIDVNRVTLSACRQYTGESVLTFSEQPLDTPPAAAPLSTPGKTLVTVPEDITFDIALDDELTMGSSLVGDAVSATLRDNIRHARKVLFAKGAKLTGRIVRLQRQQEYCLIDIHFTRIENETQRADIAADLAGPTTLPPSSSSFASAPSSDRTSVLLKGATLRLTRGTRLRVRTSTLPPSS